MSLIDVKDLERTFVVRRQERAGSPARGPRCGRSTT